VCVLLLELIKDAKGGIGMVKEVEQFYWNGRPQLNQIVISTDDGNYYLVSYGKVVASVGVDKVRLSRDWDYSVSTAKWVTRFLECESVKEVRDNIKSGRYKLVSELIIQ